MLLITIFQVYIHLRVRRTIRKVYAHRSRPISCTSHRTVGLRRSAHYRHRLQRLCAQWTQCKPRAMRWWTRLGKWSPYCTKLDLHMHRRHWRSRQTGGKLSLTKEDNSYQYFNAKYFWQNIYYPHRKNIGLHIHRRSILKIFSTRYELL